MAERNAHSIPVPEGFDLSKYDQCRNLTPGQWCHELGRRACVGMLGTAFEPDWPRHEWVPHVYHEVREILLHPIERLESSLFEPNAIRDATILDASFISRDLNQKFIDWDNIYNRSPDHLEILKEPLSDHLVIQAGLGHAVIVNLEVSDKVLLQEFKKHLKTMRARRPDTLKKPVTNDKVKKLASYNVLAILDLLIYERIAGRQLVRKDMAELLGVDYQTLVETRIPFALSAVSDEFLSDLAVISNAGA